MKIQIVIDCADPRHLGGYWVRMYEPEGNEFRVQ